MLIGRGQHLFLAGFELLHFARQLGELLFQMCGLRSEKLRCRRRLISYGPEVISQPVHAADYVDRILKGEKPADFPVQGPTNTSW